MALNFFPRALGRRVPIAGFAGAALLCAGLALPGSAAIAGGPGQGAYVPPNWLGLGALAPALPAPVRLQANVPVAADLPPCAMPGAAAADADGAAHSKTDDAGASNAPGAGGTPAFDPLEAAAAALANAAAVPPAGPDAAAPGHGPDVSPPGPAIETNEIPADGAADAGEAKLACGGAPLTIQDVAQPASYDLDYVPPDPGTPTPVKWVRPLGAPKPWFAGISTQDGIVLGERNLTYRNSEGPSLSVGSMTPFSPAWGTSIPIGGVELSNLTAANNATLPEGKLGYSSMFGRIDNTDASAMQGGIAYGTAAGTGALRYGLTPDLTLESQMQTAPSLSAAGLGTTYSVGTYGTVQAGVTQSRYETSEAMRYRLGYNVDVFDSLTLGYSSEFTGAGYNDLSTYNTGMTTDKQMRNSFSAGVPIGGWGRLSGTYSGLREVDGMMLERRYGLSQSVLIGPGVRFAVGADHDTISGDYAVNMQLSVPMGR